MDMDIQRVRPGECVCTCVGCQPWRPLPDEETFRRVLGRKCEPVQHCRHVLICRAEEAAA